MSSNEIREEIERILQSQTFADKGQLRTLLEILFKNMDSQTTLRADGVIKELWPEETRTKRSADVASEMNRLRKALESYYNGEGRSDPIKVFLPNRAAPGPDGVKDKRWIAAEPSKFKANPSVSQATPSSPLPPAQPFNSLRALAIVGTILVLGIAGILIFRLLTADRRPQFARMDDVMLTVFNAEGETLWQKNFPDGFWPEYYEPGIEQRIWIGDLDGDGRTEVLFLYNPAGDPKAHSTTLICYSSRGEEKWRFTPGRALPELNGTPPVYLTYGFGVLKATHGAHRRIVLSSQNEPFYPDQIAIIDSNGKLVSEYWHSGILDHMALADLDGSGHEEIIATGISNGYRQATLIALDPDKVFGASTETARPELQLHGMGTAQERVRLLFPRSDLNKALSVYNIAQDLTIAQGRIRLIVWECSLNPKCQILYEFDKDFNLRAVTPDDQFGSAHMGFYLNRRDDHPFSEEELAQFQKVRCLVGCSSDFVTVMLH